MIKTKYVLWGNNVTYQHYRIVGTPYIETSGGKIVLGNNFAMNNGKPNWL